MNDGIAWYTLHAVDDSYVLTSLSTHYRIAFNASSQPPQYAIITDHANRISTTFEIDAQADDITTQVWFRTGRRRTIESYVNSGSWSRTFGFRQKSRSA
jgi:hypothetical protein